MSDPDGIPKRITWWGPWPHAKKRAIHKIKSGEGDGRLFRIQFWFRPILVAWIVVAGLSIWAQSAFPNMIVPWARMAVWLFGVPLMLVGMGLIIVFIPFQVEVRRDKIAVFAGGGVNPVFGKEVDDLAIVRDGDYGFLDVVWTRRGKQRTNRLAIGRNVDLDQLQSLIDHLLAEKQHG